MEHSQPGHKMSIDEFEVWAVGAVSITPQAVGVMVHADDFELWGSPTEIAGVPVEISADVPPGVPFVKKAGRD